MIYYYFFLIAPVFLVYFFRENKKYKDLIWFLVFLFFLFISTFRYKIGSDQGDYELTFMYFYNSESLKNFPNYEPFFSFLEFVSAKINLGFQGVNFFSALIFLIGLIFLIREEKKNWLCLYLALPYFYFAVSWGFLRQSVSLGFIFLCIYFYKKNQIINLFISFLLAILSHKFSLLFFPILFFSMIKKKIYKILLICFACSILIFFSYYVVVLNQTYLQQFITNIPEGYTPKGANLRALMSLIPSVIYIIYYKRMKKFNDHKFYLNSSIVCVFLFFLNFLFAIPSMRIGVFFGHVQFILLPRIIDEFKGKINFALTSLVILFYFIVFQAWLIYSPHKDLWVPFKFIF